MRNEAFLLVGMTEHFYGSLTIFVVPINECPKLYVATVPSGRYIGRKRDSDMPQSPVGTIYQFYKVLSLQDLLVHSSSFSTYMSSLTRLRRTMSL